MKITPSPVSAAATSREPPLLRFAATSPTSEPVCAVEGSVTLDTREKGVPDRLFCRLFCSTYTVFVNPVPEEKLPTATAKSGTLWPVKLPTAKPENCRVGEFAGMHVGNGGMKHIPTLMMGIKLTTPGVLALMS